MSDKNRRLRRRSAIAAGIAVVAAAAATPAALASSNHHGKPGRPGKPVAARSPIKHLVVIFQENVSYDHYFGTYPVAANTDGTPFHAAKGTPKSNGLTKQLLNHNPNEYNPQRLTPAEALTCDQNHGYTAEQKAFNGGRMNQFVQYTESDKCGGEYGPPGIVMDYYDGNTVTGLWNYAQHYAMSDNSYGTVFGPSTPGAINLVSGQTYGAYAVDPTTGKRTNASFIGSPGKNGLGTLFTDTDPYYDDCSDGNRTSTNPEAVMTGRNIGTELDAAHVTWGWFEGGFAPTATVHGVAQCKAAIPNVGGGSVTSYIPHHDPFQYYKSTANPHHLPPTSERMIGKQDQANHQYDITDFFKTLKDGNMPAVSFLKAPGAQDGHAGYSDPLDEQKFLVNTINQIEKSPEWSSTAIVINYDDSDGWYDHVASKVINGSSDPSLDSAIECGGKPAVDNLQDRCGPGPRIPMLVISPYSKTNFIDNTETNQASITKFIDVNWGLPMLGNLGYDGGSFVKTSNGLDSFFDFRKPHFAPVILNPNTGAVVRGHEG
jgi:phospholipase C